jgi:hypothetical protein
MVSSSHMNATKGLFHSFQRSYTMLGDAHWDVVPYLLALSVIHGYSSVESCRNPIFSVAMCLPVCDGTKTAERCFYNI